MADNTTMGSTTDVVRDVDRAGVKTQVVGMDLGIGTGTESLMSATNPMPVNLASGGTYATTTVNTSGTANTNTTLVGANAARKAVMVWNNGTGVVSIGLGTSTTSTLFSFKLQPGQGYDIPAQFAPAAITCQSTVATNPINVSSVT